jgi:hypothetical protein
MRRVHRLLEIELRLGEQMNVAAPIKTVVTGGRLDQPLFAALIASHGQ